jgi:hypothetical protein
MTDNESFTVCPYCDERVDPNESGVTYAVEVRRIDTMGSTQYVDGMGAFFHPGCPPSAVGYSPRQMPGADPMTP